MTDKRERVITDPGLGPLDPPGPSTLRSLEAAEELAALSPNSPVYYEPAPLVAISDHKTLEVQTVKLSDEIDPRKLQTELRLDRMPSFVPPSDSFWPPETALSSSQPPSSPSRRWRTPVVLLSLLGALLLLVVARAVSRRSDQAARASGIVQTVSGAGLAPLAASAAVPAAPVPVVAVEAAPVATPPEAAPSSSVEVPAPAALAPVAVSPHVVKAKQHSSAPPIVASVSKPKRAIY